MATIKVVDGVEEVTMQDLMDAYRELQAARENLTHVKDMLKAARERVAMAELTLERLFVRLEGEK